MKRIIPQLQIGIAAALLVASSSGLFATTTTLQPGSTGKDTWIWNQEDFSHGDWGELRANQTAAFDQRILIEFDLSSIPGGVTINSATLGLYRYDGYTSLPLILDAHRITTPWTEAVTYSTAPVFDASIQSSATVTVNGWYTWDLTAAVSAWTSGAWANNGVGIYDHGSTFFQRFVSSDNVGATEPSFALPPRDPSLRPYLEIDFTAVPEPSTFVAGVLLALPLGLQGVRWLRTRKHLS